MLSPPRFQQKSKFHPKWYNFYKIRNFYLTWKLLCIIFIAFNFFVEHNQTAGDLDVDGPEQPTSNVNAINIHFIKIWTIRPEFDVPLFIVTCWQLNFDDQYFFKISPWLRSGFHVGLSLRKFLNEPITKDEIWTTFLIIKRGKQIAYNCLHILF